MNTDTILTKIGLLLVFSPLLYAIARCLDAVLGS